MAAAAQAEAATQQAVVPVVAGETLTELQALEGLLVAQGNDMALLLSRLGRFEHQRRSWPR